LAHPPQKIPFYGKTIYAVITHSKLSLMKRFTKLSARFFVVALMCALSFWLGKRLNEKDAFERGAKLQSERNAMFRAVDSYQRVKLIDEGKTDQLKTTSVNGMWMSIVRMDEMLSNPDATDLDRERMNNFLPRVVEYYYNNPKIIEKPQSADIADDVDQRLESKENAKETKSTEKEAIGAIREVSKEPMRQLDGMFNAVLDETYKQDLKTQEVLMRHIAQRNFPGRTSIAAGITFKMPNDTGGGGSSVDDFHFNGKKIRVLYENGKLSVNDKDFGSISKGDTVDLRMLGKVFVNDVERSPNSP
jgi:hypothetical protein